ncbi:MAG: hypothetical protein V6Z89_22460 [Desulfobacter sp.]
MTQSKQTNRRKGVIGIMGHAGAGHVHSHCGFVQDDSAGFAAAIALIRRTYPADTVIREVSLDVDAATGAEQVVVETGGGGRGMARVRRGITPYEMAGARRIAGMDGIFSQPAAFAACGRIYGQGVLEFPVALQTAVCLAVMDTFIRTHPGVFATGRETSSGRMDQMLGAVVPIGGHPVSVLATLNAVDGGLGPDEDLEGNVMLGEKGRVMAALGLHRIPTLILESKAYVPAVCRGTRENRFWVRINGEVDNCTVYDALNAGAKAAGVSVFASDTAYPRGGGDMARATRALGDRIVELGHCLAESKTAAEKVAVAGELALLVSQDAGGVTFMSDDLNDVVGGGGLVPGTGAVLSMAVSEPEIRKWKIPVYTEQDLEDTLRVVDRTIPILAAHLAEAEKEIEEKWNFQPESFARLVGRQLMGKH